MAPWNGPNNTQVRVIAASHTAARTQQHRNPQQQENDGECEKEPEEVTPRNIYKAAFGARLKLLHCDKVMRRIIAIW